MTEAVSPTKSEEARTFLAKFFACVRAGNQTAATECIAASAFPDGPTQAPSPRAAFSVESGEWDSQRDPVQLWKVGPDACCGRIGTSDPPKVCIRNQAMCTVDAHRKGKIRVVGWVIGAGPKVSDGAYCSLVLPSKEDGGPVDDLVAAKLVDFTSPFRMPVSFWKFVFQANSEDLTGLEGSPRPVEGRQMLVVKTADEWSVLEGERDVWVGGLGHSTRSAASGLSEESDRLTGDAVGELGLFKTKVLLLHRSTTIDLLVIEVAGPGDTGSLPRSLPRVDFRCRPDQRRN
jgi:hypothetical protein